MLANQTISLVNNCNLSCTYCWYETDVLGYSTRQLRAQEYRVWFEACNAYGELGVAYLTGGEPTLHQEISEILTECCKYFEQVVLMTNGTRLSRYAELVEQLANQQVSVHVSLDHVSTSIRDRVRGGTKLVLEGLDILANKGISTQIIVVVTAANAVDMPRIIEFCTSRNFRLEMIIVSVPEIHPLSVRSLSMEKRIHLVEAIESAPILVGKQSYYSQVKNYLLGGSINKLRYCLAAQTGIFIESNGDVFVCPQRRNDSLGSILTSAPAAIAREKQAQMNLSPPGRCVTLNCLAIS